MLKEIMENCILINLYTTIVALLYLMNLNKNVSKNHNYLINTASFLLFLSHSILIYLISFLYFFMIFFTFSISFVSFQGERATGYGVALLLTLFGNYTKCNMLQSIASNDVEPPTKRICRD